MSAIEWAIVDIESTGLDRNVDHILEIGFVFLDGDLEERGAFSFLTPTRDGILRVHQIRKAVDDGTATDNEKIVDEMHVKSGLWDDLRDTRSVSDYIVCETRVNSMLRAMAIPEGINLMGSTVGFDKAFLEDKMPSVLEHFHYRSVDVSTLKTLAARYRPDVIKIRDSALEPKKSHRVLDDCRDTAGELEVYVEELFRK